MDKNEIINRIGYIRVRAKLTQKALSNAIEMNPAYINRLESKREFLPSLEVLLRIISECGSTPEEFFCNDINQYEKEKQLRAEIKALPDNVKSFILNYDPEIMNLFIRLNEKAAKLNETDLQRARNSADTSERYEKKNS